MNDSIFARILRNEIPAYKIYEDDKTLAFLDIHPVQPGQVLVIPKQPAEYIWDLPDQDYAAVMNCAKLIADRLRQVFPSKLVGMQIEGLDVKYAHLKLFPFKNEEEYRFVPDMSTDPDNDSLEIMAHKLTEGWSLAP
jgi:histidine triad (HIT) family protein